MPDRPADPVVSPADTPDALAEKLRSLARAGMPHTHGLVNSFDPECSPDRWCARCDFDAALDALLAVGERDKAEIARLADRAVCSGCGQDVDEGGACHTLECLDGEMIPSSDLPRALLDLCEKNAEEREEWRSDWEELRAEAKALEVAGERDRRQIARLTERLIDAQQLLARVEFLRHGGGATRPMDGESIDIFACPTCGWPKGGHPGPGRIKGNAENTHEEGCSLYAALHGLPAPRLLACNDRPARAVLADEEDARP